MDSWRPHCYPKGWKQDPDELYNDFSEDNFVGEAKEALGQITGTPSKGAAAEKGEPKMFRAEQCWIYDLQVLNPLNRDKDTLLQPVHPTKIAMAMYVSGDASKWGFGSGLSIPMYGSDVMEDGPERVHARHYIWCEEYHIKSIDNR